jgi:hypothetical protein
MGMEQSDRNGGLGKFLRNCIRTLDDRTFIIRYRFTWDYWWNGRLVDKVARKRKHAEDHDKKRPILLSLLTNAERQIHLHAEELILKGLFDEILRRGIKVDDQWISSLHRDQIVSYRVGLISYPPFSERAKELMIAAIQRDRIANIEKWLIRIILPIITLIGSFVGAYFGSRK